VRMVLLTNDAEKVISMLERNFGGSNRIIEQLLEEAKLQKSVKNKLGGESNRDCGECRRTCKFPKQQRDQRTVEEIA
jgi:hypothetical protein